MAMGIESYYSYPPHVSSNHRGRFDQLAPLGVWSDYYEEWRQHGEYLQPLQLYDEFSQCKDDMKQLIIILWDPTHHSQTWNAGNKMLGHHRTIKFTLLEDQL